MDVIDKHPQRRYITHIFLKKSPYHYEMITRGKKRMDETGEEKKM